LAGCTRVFVEKAFGAQREGPEVQAALKQFIETVEALEQREVGASTLYRHLRGGRSAALGEQQS